jgi:hypothetical protein
MPPSSHRASNARQTRSLRLEEPGPVRVVRNDEGSLPHVNSLDAKGLVFSAARLRLLGQRPALRLDLNHGGLPTPVQVGHTYCLWMPSIDHIHEARPRERSSMREKWF